MSGNRENLSDAQTEDAADLEPEFTYEQLISDMRSLHDQFGVPFLKKGEFTAVMYSDLFGLDRGSALRELSDAVASGEFIEINEERRVDGKRVKHVYKKVIEDVE